MKDVDLYVTTDADALSGPTSDITNLTGQPCVVIPHGGGVSLNFIGRPFDSRSTRRRFWSLQKRTRTLQHFTRIALLVLFNESSSKNDV